MGRAIGQFRDALSKIGARENTFLWHTSDNGVSVEGIPEEQRKDLYNGHWRDHKGTLCEGGLRVPAIIE